MYLTVRPRTAPDDRHPFAYEAVEPPGRIVYDPNPFVSYRVDLRDPIVTVVSANLRHHVTFTPAGGTPLDMSHEGTVTVTKRSGAQALDTVSLFLVFSGFTSSGSPVFLNVEIDRLGQATGNVRQGNTSLATVIQGHFDRSNSAILSWQGVCATASS